MLGELAGRLRGRAGFEDSHVTVATHAKLGEKLAEGVGAGGGRRRSSRNCAR